MRTHTHKFPVPRIVVEKQNAEEEEKNGAAGVSE